MFTASLCIDGLVTCCFSGLVFKQSQFHNQMEFRPTCRRICSSKNPPPFHCKSSRYRVFPLEPNSPIFHQLSARIPQTDFQLVIACALRWILLVSRRHFLRIYSFVPLEHTCRVSMSECGERVAYRKTLFVIL
jgi:hypothetical protein